MMMYTNVEFLLNKLKYCRYMARHFTLRTFLATLLLSIPAMLMAAPVSQTQAAAIAQAFMKQQGIVASNAKASTIRRSQPKEQQTSATSYYYVFNASGDNGFVIVSGDDRTPQILGYSDAGSLDVNAMPENIKSFLQSYADGIKYLDEKGISAKQNVALSKSGTTHSIAPLLQSEWNQSSPYNDNCPTVNGSKAVTGCVATAMAQVLYYFRYPNATIAAIPSYQNTSDKSTISSVAAGAALDWDNMLPQYTSSASSVQKTAVANLMLYAGKSVQMQYDASGSSATNASIVPALKTYFGYGAQFIDRSNYSLSQFEDKLYTEVAASRPVIFCGTSTGGGHCFVVDGYDPENNLFHVNWGWGGRSNGYFLISVLNPGNNSGIGASTSRDGYSMNQSAVIGITPGSSSEITEPLALSLRNLAISNGNLTGAYYNWTGEDNTFDAAIAQVDADGNVVKVLKSLLAGKLNVNTGYGLNELISELGLPQGTCYIAFASRVQGAQTWVVRNTDIVKVTVSASGNITASFASDAGNLSVTNWEFTGTKTTGTSQSVKITISNTGSDYYHNVYLLAGTSTDDRAIHSGTGLTVAANGTSTIDMSFTPSSAGKYTLWLYTAGDQENSVNDLIGQTTVDIAEGSSTVNLSVDKSTMRNSVNNTIYGKSFSGTVTVKNNATSAFGGQLYLFLFGGDGKSITYIQPSVNIAAGATQDIDFDFGGLSAGYYTAGLYYNKTSIGQLSWYNLQPGMITYKADGTSTASAPTATVTMPSDATAIDLTDVEGSVTTVTPNDNPNALYIFNTETSAATALKAAGRNVVASGQTDDLELTDGYDFSSPVDFNAAKATFKRTLATGTDGTTPAWYTISLPFTVSSITADGKDKSWFTSSTDEGKNMWVMEFAGIDGANVLFDYNSGNTIEANTPYIISVPNDKWGSKWNLACKELSFTGNDVAVAANAGAVIGSVVYNFTGSTKKRAAAAYILDTAGNKFEFNANGTVSPFTAYFVARNSQAASALTSLGIAINGGMTTAIKSVTTATATAGNDAEYNLSGQRVGKDYRGIVIKNGKKIIRK